MTDTMRGSCLCGGVTFEVTEPFVRVSQCHCTTCKRISGGTGTVSGIVDTDAIRIVAGRDVIETYQPAEGTAKSFCGVCGSNLFGGGWPDSPMTSVRITTLDQSLDRRPEMHIFVRSVAPWETLPEDGAKRYDARPPKRTGPTRHGAR